MLIPKIQIPKAESFDLPEGTFKATIDDIRYTTKQKAKGAADWLRFVFRVDVPGINRFAAKAGRNFEINLHPGSDLRNFLTSLLGDKFFTDWAEEVFEFESLIGMGCEIDLVHRQGKTYAKPFVMVANIRPNEKGAKL